MSKKHKERMTPCSTWLDPIKKFRHDSIAQTAVFKQEAIIVDLDGTTAYSTNRGWYEEEKCESDEPNIPVIEVIQNYILYTSTEVIFVSGRQDKAFEQSRDWIFKHVYINGFFNENLRNLGDIKSNIKLYMRKTGDTRDDAVVKEEIYHEHIEPHYQVISVFDDRPRVVKMWKSLKLFVFNCYQDEEDF